MTYTALVDQVTQLLHFLWQVRPQGNSRLSSGFQNSAFGADRRQHRKPAFLFPKRRLSLTPPPPPPPPPLTAAAYRRRLPPLFLLLRQHDGYMQDDPTMVRARTLVPSTWHGHASRTPPSDQQVSQIMQSTTVRAVAGRPAVSRTRVIHTRQNKCHTVAGAAGRSSSRWCCRQACTTSAAGARTCSPRCRLSTAH